jgi:hypothetical protein
VTIDVRPLRDEDDHDRAPGESARSFPLVVIPERRPSAAQDGVSGIHA